MKKILLLLLSLSFVTIEVFAQKTCKVQEINNPFYDGTIPGEKITGIVVPTNQGKCIISKIDTGVRIVFKVSGFSSMITAGSNDVSIRLQHGELSFERSTAIKISLSGNAITTNYSVVKPILSNPTFVFYMNDELKKAFVSTLGSIRITIYGEKGSEGAMVFNKKEVAKIISAMNCL